MDKCDRDTLVYYDSATETESPDDFDYPASLAAVRTFQPAAEAILGQPLQRDESVQDASYFAELFLLEDGAIGPNGSMAHVFKVGIRFSAFGRMATIHTNSVQSDLRNYPVERLAKLLEEHGFRYIDVRSLQEPYDGAFPGLGQPPTWWLRYFDYL